MRSCKPVTILHDGRHVCRTSTHSHIQKTAGGKHINTAAWPVCIVTFVGHWLRKISTLSTSFCLPCGFECLDVGSRQARV